MYSVPSSVASATHPRHSNSTDIPHQSDLVGDHRVVKYRSSYAIGVILQGPWAFLVRLVILSLLCHIARSQDSTSDGTFDFIWTGPGTQPSQCTDFEFFWIGGTPPFELQIALVDDGEQVDICDDIQDRAFIWTADFPVDDALSLVLIDSQGLLTFNSRPVVIASSSNDTCLPDRNSKPVVTLGAPLPSTTSSSSTFNTTTSTSTTLTSSATHTMSAGTSSKTTSSLHSTLTSSRPSLESVVLSTSSARTSSPTESLPTTLASSSENTLTPVPTLTPTPPPSLTIAPSAVSAAAHTPLHSSAIVGIVAGTSVAALLIISAVVLYFARRHRATSVHSQHLSDDNPSTLTPVGPRPRPPAKSVQLMSERGSTSSPFGFASSYGGPNASGLLGQRDTYFSATPEPAHDPESVAAQPSSSDVLARADSGAGGDGDSRAPSRAAAKLRAALAGESPGPCEVSRPFSPSSVALVSPSSLSLSLSGGFGWDGSVRERAGTPRMEMDGGVRLAGGPPDERGRGREDGERGDGDGESSEEGTLPPPYRRY
ncbi:hypothetical protein C8Q80DRAFT_449633 [Daedaleopsis nitida]|nr:hypothetical protein C8Q80DRAFT_449633 [Daedaleopsis nitida]